MSHPRVGIGVIIVRDDGKILVGKRKGSHAPPPGRSPADTLNQEKRLKKHQ
ncbi:hypothetical protein [Endozoicomonas sp. YOMI1]|uniref:hypothetical protein n=1 Tax=Endozoicomonas sp. YOMI1 TaxID=2828739 RepID=UPI0021496AC1|nr:hypothetical protein [Endozoicomonas sp. YOMI1]